MSRAPTVHEKRMAAAHTELCEAFDKGCQDPFLRLFVAAALVLVDVLDDIRIAIPDTYVEEGGHR